ncbi:hypothetical protein M378DRAFT_625088 [Amanita muscaria Koide BX008]|uniref:Uncharacterized protein n=1 Tax=Amanita muscaria (strain Koide BX008) TaxID=946122 RepID=A0A0C2T3M4_AMAMK|nr:hypothetical protein M378DRAFT_625088 [Amanita muscaria Koide BX008]
MGYLQGQSSQLIREIPRYSHADYIKTIQKKTSDVCNAGESITAVIKVINLDAVAYWRKKKGIKGMFLDRTGRIKKSWFTSQAGRIFCPFDI